VTIRNLVVYISTNSEEQNSKIMSSSLGYGAMGCEHDYTYSNIPHSILQTVHHTGLGLCEVKRKESETNVDSQNFHNIGTPNIDLFPTRTNRNCFLQSFLTSSSMCLRCFVDKLGMKKD